MATFDLGKLKFNWRGDYADSTAYEVDDVVLHKNGTWICTTDVAATNTTDPEANDNFSRMATGIDFQSADFATSTAYYLNDLVKFSSAVYIVTSDTVTADTGEDPSTLTNDFAIFTPAPEGNVLTTDGDMITRRGGNSIRIPITKTVDKGLTVQKHKTETYPSRSFTYTEDNDNAVAENKSGSIPAVSYSITVKNRMDDSYILTGSDRNGNFTNEEEYSINVNIGDTLTFDTTAAGSGHPLHIRVSNDGDSITAGTGGSYTGEGDDEVVWNTTGMAAGTYFYQCENHTAMVGEIIVNDPTNTQGSSSENASIDCTRGEEYTITLTGLTTDVSYNLFTTDTTHTVISANEVTEAQGNGAEGGTTYTGSDVEFTFSPNETTPNAVYLTDGGGSDARLTINIHDAIYVPSWGEADAAASSPGARDAREFVFWQDWYGGDTADQTSGTPSDVNHGVILPEDTRDPGAKVKVNGTAVGAKQRRVWRGDTNNYQEFTVPDGVEKVRITAIGGGGGAGSYGSHYMGGTGGGGGAFTSGEYTVEAGDIIRVSPGHGGYGDRAATGGTGGTTTVQDNNGGTLGGKINISCEAGTGGHYGTSIGLGGDTITLGGTSLQTGNQYKSAGGNGGYGAPSGIGWSPEGFVSGGGGSSGSVYGPGFNGGSASGSYDGGYWYAGCGGAGIGGNGGSGSTNYTPSEYHPAGGGGGGGSAGPGEHGGTAGHANNGPSHISTSGKAGRGGAGIASSVYIDGYTDIMPEVAGYPAAADYRGMRDGDWETIDTDLTMELIGMAGARFGDGEAEHPEGGWDTSVHKQNRFIRPLNENNNFTSRLVVQEEKYGTKAFNGVLGRLWGGGGAGGHTSNAPSGGWACTGGEGGSGGGGGGGCSYVTNHGRGDGPAYQHQWTVWDPANMAFRIHDKHRCNAAPGLVDTSTTYGTAIGSGAAGDGGHGGACGGGGAGCYYGRDGGWGGIGGGGGGASGVYSPVRPGTGGHGGVGYVLIEWAK
jgi:plastocyanin